MTFAAPTLPEAAAAAGDPVAALSLARELGARLPLPGQGDSVAMWSALAGLGATDLTVARSVEPHLDAVAILDQAGDVDVAALGVDGASTWGVFAAEGPGVRLEATYDTTGDGRDWTLTGTKPWCSLAGLLTHALVTAWTGPESRRLFAVRLTVPEVTVTDQPWQARGLTAVTSVPVEMSAAPAVSVGDDGRADGPAGAALALRVRQVVRRAAEEVLDRSQHALGPGPLVGEAEHAARVADLQLYLRQEHAERDQAALGRHLVEHPGDAPW